MSKSYRIVVLILILGFLGWLGLFLIERQFGLGRFAENPQRVELFPGRRAIVGGGRAVLGYVGPEKKDKVKLEVGCAAQKITTDVAQGAVGEEICGVRVRWLGPVDALEPKWGKARFEISWTE